MSDNIIDRDKLHEERAKRFEEKAKESPEYVERVLSKRPQSNKCYDCGSPGKPVVEKGVVQRLNGRIWFRCVKCKKVWN